jgi:hypothetical protein
MKRRSLPQLLNCLIKSWNIELVRRNFIALEADAILNIPLRRDGGEDFRAWSLERIGIYIVKFAYRALMSRGEQSALDEGAITGTSESQKHL